MYSIFQPFTWDVWVLHVGMMVFGAFAILFMEATGLTVRRLFIPAEDDDLPTDDDGKPMRLSANGMLKSFFASLTHFLWNGPKHEPQTAAGKVALFALSFHTLIVAASYTASLAGFLATSSPVPVVVLSFDSIKTSPLTSLTGRLCVLQSAQASTSKAKIPSRARARRNRSRACTRARPRVRVRVRVCFVYEHALLASLSPKCLPAAVPVAARRVATAVWYQLAPRNDD
jgi:hypothetical protein